MQTEIKVYVLKSKFKQMLKIQTELHYIGVIQDTIPIKDSKAKVASNLRVSKVFSLELNQQNGIMNKESSLKPETDEGKKKIQRMKQRNQINEGRTKGRREREISHNLIKCIPLAAVNNVKCMH